MRALSEPAFRSSAPDGQQRPSPGNRAPGNARAADSWQRPRGQRLEEARLRVLSRVTSHIALHTRLRLHSQEWAHLSGLLRGVVPLRRGTEGDTRWKGRAGPSVPCRARGGPA